MRNISPGLFARTVRPLALLTCAVLAACASTPEKAAPGATKAAAAPVGVPVGDLAAARRCMDNLMVDYGPRELSVVVEDLADPNRRFNAGTKEMLVSVVSDMTQRSRAIRLVASGKGWDAAGGADREPAPAQYSLRGSISQPERNGAGARAANSMLGLDLMLLSTRDMSIVPGAASRNALALYDGSAGREGRAELRKFGLVFSLPTSAEDGAAQALRGLAELGVIELFGRLARVPYWSCFGAQPNEPKVAAEIQDWYDTMAARPAEIIGYFQQQLHLRHAYEGPVDGVVNPELKEAVARYRAMLGLSREPKLSLDFFQAYLSADPHAIDSYHAPAVAAVTTPVTVSTGSPVTVVSAGPATTALVVATAEAPLALRIVAGSDSPRFARGEPVQLSIKPNRDAFVYCFHQDENRKITRFFPNRFQSSPRVLASAALQLPGAMRFEIVMNPRGAPEAVSCFATERDVLAQLPAGLNAGDFSPLAVASLDQLRSAFLKVSGGALAQDQLQLRSR